MKKVLFLLLCFTKIVFALDPANIAKELGERITAAKVGTENMLSEANLPVLAKLRGVETIMQFASPLVPLLDVSGYILTALEAMLNSPESALIFNEENIYERSEYFMAFIVPESICKISPFSLPYDTCEEIFMSNSIILVVHKHDDNWRIVLRSARPFSDEYQDIYSLDLPGNTYEHKLNLTFITRLVGQYIKATLDGDVRFKISYPTTEKEAECYNQAKGCYEVYLERDFTAQPYNIYIYPDNDLKGPTFGLYVLDDDKVGFRLAVRGAGLATNFMSIGANIPRLNSYVAVDGVKKIAEIESLHMSKNIIFSMGGMVTKIFLDVARAQQPAVVKLDDTSMEFTAPLFTFIGELYGKNPGHGSIKYNAEMSARETSPCEGVRLTYMPREADDEHALHDEYILETCKNICAKNALFRVDDGSAYVKIKTEVTPEGGSAEVNLVDLDMAAGESFHYRPN